MDDTPGVATVAHVEDVQRHQMRFVPPTKSGRGAGTRIANDARWLVFQRWAVFFGFAWQLGDGALVPDPTDVVVAVLDEVLPNGADLDLKTFASQLATAIPVVDRGRLWTALH